MSSPFEDQRSIFAVLDRQGAWGAFLAARLVGDGEAHHVRRAKIDVRHMEDLEALDSCLVDNATPVGVLLADDFAELHELASFVARHAGRPRTFLVIAGHTRESEIGSLLQECGAHLVVQSIEEVMMVAGPLRRFFEQARGVDSARLPY